jgi:glycosyltransferase involved in cell wall biosynthesis
VPSRTPMESSVDAPARAPRSFGILSTFPPTACGIATFSAALSAGLIANGDSVDVVRVSPHAGLEDPQVLGTIGGSAATRAAGIDVLNRTDVAIVQHEYGIYGGPDGEDLIPVMDAIRVPIVVVAHTVLIDPTPNQRAVLTQVCERAVAVVVMTESARQRLSSVFGVDPAKVRVIAHGAATPLGRPRLRATGSTPTLLTWGLLGPGKGIEWAIDAMARLADMRPRARYLVAGATHPKVREREGEEYRNMLIQRSWGAGVSPQVTFDDAYRDLPSLTALITSADLVVLPYDSAEQVTSGVLVDAIAAGRPVVSTAFPHAVELLASGAGIVVPQRDPVALADAIRTALTDAALLADMGAEARRLAPALSWDSVAEQYSDLAGRLLAVAR